MNGRIFFDEIEAKVTLDGSDALYIDYGIDRESDTYRAEIVTTSSIVTYTDGTPARIDVTAQGHRQISISAHLGQYDDEIKARLDKTNTGDTDQERTLESIALATELVEQGVKTDVAVFGAVTRGAITDQIRSLIRHRVKMIIARRIDLIRSEIPKNYLFIWKITIPKGSKPGLYKFDETESTFDPKQLKWITTVISTEEKTVKEIVDDPEKALCRSRIIGRTAVNRTLKPLEILDAQPEMKKRAILLLVNLEGGVQPIWRIEDGNFRSIAVTEETEAGLRIKGIGQIVRGTAAQILRGEALPDYSGIIYDADSEPAPEQWAVLLRDIKEAANS